MHRPSARAILLALPLLVIAPACGVKGPPLPPVPNTPQHSDPAEPRARTSPAPSPKPAAKPAPAPTQRGPRR